MSETQEPTLRLGDEGTDGWVEYAQRLLIFNGKDCGAVDGRFGPRTLAAVQAFQSSRKLLVDGVIGNQTWASLRGGAPEAPSTDGRDPGTFQESGPEARWFVEGDGLVFTVADDVVHVFAANTGDVVIAAGAFFADAVITSSRGEELQLPLTILPGTAAAPGDNFVWLLERLFTDHGPGTYAVVATMPAELGGDSKRFTVTFDGDDPSFLLTTASQLLCPHFGAVRVIATSTATLGTGAPVLLATDPVVVSCTAPDPLSHCVTVVWVSPGGRTFHRGSPVLTRAATGLCLAGAGVPTGPVLIVA